MALMVHLGIRPGTHDVFDVVDITNAITWTVHEFNLNLGSSYEIKSHKLRAKDRCSARITIESQDIEHRRISTSMVTDAIVHRVTERLGRKKARWPLGVGVKLWSGSEGREWVVE